jgi:predicted DNA binding protein
MAIIVEFSLPAEAFPFGQSTHGDPEVRVSLERVIPIERGRIPFVWATGETLDQFEQTLTDSEIVAHAEAITRVGDSVLYAVEWYEDKEVFLNGLGDTGATILEAHGDSTWSFTVRFKNHTDLTQFHQFYQAHDFPVHIDLVASLEDEPGTEYGFGLTPAQREALTLAVENGYFAIPRETQLEEVADELGISKQATSERVRRGAETVLRKALVGLVAADFEPPNDE